MHASFTGRPQRLPNATCTGESAYLHTPRFSMLYRFALLHFPICLVHASLR